MKTFMLKLMATSAVMCFSGAIGLKYHADQIDANNVLVQKVQLLEATAIQNFDPVLHVNEMDQLHLIAEVPSDRQVIINIGSEGVARWVQVTPLYPVSRQSRPLLESAGKERRPMPRANASKLAIENFELAKIEATPFAFAVLELPDGARSNLDFDPFGENLGEGSMGSLIRLTGVFLDRNSLVSQIDQSLSHYGLEVSADAVFVTPYAPGQNGTLVVPDHSRKQTLLLSGGALMTALFFATLFGLFPPKPNQNRHKRPESVEAVGNFPSVDFFEPILSQEELAADQEAERRHRRGLSRVA